MSEKYEIKAKPAPPRLPRIGKFGVVDWREDCSRCHNCVKKECIYDRYRQEMEYIRHLNNVEALFFDCMGCFSCVQNCTKGLLCLSVNSEYERLGNAYYTPEIIVATWNQAETGKVPVSGAGYKGKFSGKGFDAIWTDMSEIVRPTRDGIHGREYISTSADIGRKPSYLTYGDSQIPSASFPLLSVPMPLIIDMRPKDYNLANLSSLIAQTAAKTDLIALVDSNDWDGLDKDWSAKGVDRDALLPHVAFYLNPEAPLPPADILKKNRLIEIPDGEDLMERLKDVQKNSPQAIISVRVPLTITSANRVIALAHEGIAVLHAVADHNGQTLDADSQTFVTEMIRKIHTTLVKDGIRDETTLIFGGGIALAEHMAKAIICGADLVSLYLPILIALECRLCQVCNSEWRCPAGLETIDSGYAINRMTNLLSSWHLQLIEVMGAMGMREARRLRGDVGRAMFFDALEEEIFGKIFGKRKSA